MSYKPSIRMVPGPLWGMNLRRMLPKSRWQKIRHGLIQERGLRCQTCRKTEMQSKRIFAHEEWEYEATSSPAVAHLRGLTSNCWHGRAVQHFGATGNMVRSGELTAQAIEDTIEHFCRVNQVSRDAFNAHRAEARAEWTRFSKMKWKGDRGAFAALVIAADEKRRARLERAKKNTRRNTKIRRSTNGLISIQENHSKLRSTTTDIVALALYPRFRGNDDKNGPECLDVLDFSLRCYGRL